MKYNYSIFNQSATLTDNTYCETMLNKESDTEYYFIKKSGTNETKVSLELMHEYTSNMFTEVNNDLAVFVKAFKNQRKMYKFLQASIDLDENIITEEEFETISEECIMFIKNTSEEETYDNILSLLKYTEDNFTIDELAGLLEVSVEKSTKIVYDLRGNEPLAVEG